MNATVCDECGGVLKRFAGLWKGERALWRCVSCGAVVGDVPAPAGKMLAHVGALAKRDGEPGEAALRYIVTNGLDRDEDGSRFAPVVAYAIAKGRVRAFEQEPWEGNMGTVEIEKGLRAAVRAGTWSGTETKEDVLALARHRAEGYYMANKAPTRQQALQQALSEPLDPWQPARDDTNPTLHALHEAAPADAAEAQRRQEMQKRQASDARVVALAKGAAAQGRETAAAAARHKHELERLQDEGASAQELKRTQTRHAKELATARAKDLIAGYAGVAQDVGRGSR